MKEVVWLRVWGGEVVREVGVVDRLRGFNLT